MKIELSLGETLEVATAFCDNCGDIHVTCKDSFELLTKLSGFPVTSAALVEYEEEWCLMVRLDIPESFVDEYEDYYTFEIENQCQIQRLKAFL